MNLFFSHKCLLSVMNEYNPSQSQDSMDLLLLGLYEVPIDPQNNQGPRCSSYP